VLLNVVPVWGLWIFLRLLAKVSATSCWLLVNSPFGLVIRICFWFAFPVPVSLLNVLQNILPSRMLFRLAVAFSHCACLSCFIALATCL